MEIRSITHSFFSIRGEILKPHYEQMLKECKCWRTMGKCPRGEYFLKELYSWSENNPLHPFLVWKICDPCYFKEPYEDPDWHHWV